MMMTTRRHVLRQTRVVAVSAAALSFFGMRPARAQLSLDQARREKLVGERSDGLLGALVNRADVVEMVERLNAERMAAYQKIAGDENIPVSQVQAIAAQQILPRLPAGSVYMDNNGRWVER